MKFPLPSFGRSQDKKPMTDGQRNRRLVIGLAIRLIVICMLIGGVIYIAIGIFTGTSITVPQSAQGVLSGVEQPTSYSWSSEAVRLVRLGGKQMRQDSVRQATLDLKRNRYWMVSAGTLPERTFYSSDGKLMLRLTQTDVNNEAGWRRWSNICQKDPPVPAQTLAMPTASQITKLNPDIVTDKGSYLGQRAWVISFKPSPALISQMMGLSFYQQAASPLDNRWVMSARERKALASGQFKADIARIWVLRQKPRKLMQISIRFRLTIPGGSARNLLARRVVDRELGGTPLVKLNFGNPCRNQATGDVVTPDTNNLPSDQDLTTVAP